MKNTLLSLVAILVFTFFGNAQYFEDNFESYNLGDMGIQNPAVWSVWSGNPISEPGINIAEGNGGQVGYIGPSSGQDVLLLLQNRTSGLLTLSFQMFIPAGSTGYLNIQGETEINASTGYIGAYGAGNAGGETGIYNSGILYINQGAANPGIFRDDLTGETATYPEDEWFPVNIYFDLFDPSYQISINGKIVNVNYVPFQEDEILGALNFYSIDANTNIYLDSFSYTEGIIGFDDFSTKNFQIYPNPVTDVLHLHSAAIISNIKVATILGKQVLKARPNSISPSLDMSNLSPGLYFVSVTIDNSSKTFKILK